MGAANVNPALHRRLPAIDATTQWEPWDTSVPTPENLGTECRLYLVPSNFCDCLLAWLDVFVTSEAFQRFVNRTGPQTKLLDLKVGGMYAEKEWVQQLWGGQIITSGERERREKREKESIFTLGVVASNFPAAWLYP